MYFAAQSKDVKLHQDFSDSREFDKGFALVLCDGIGSFENSGKAAEIVCNTVIGQIDKLPINEIIQQSYKKIRSLNEEMGTTLLVANQLDRDLIRICYLGNGGVLRLSGDFHELPYTSHPYRIADLMLPHTTPSGALYKHISHNSGELELETSEVTLNLNNPMGDIIILFTDGISSLEENTLISDPEDDRSFWRNESSSVQFILEELHQFLVNQKDNINNKLLNQLLINILEKLKMKDYLEDDASLAIILTDKTIDSYKQKYD